MKNTKTITVIFCTLILTLGISLTAMAQDKKKKTEENTISIVSTNNSGKGQQFILTVIKGEHHNNPMMAAWLEDDSGTYIQTLYVNESVARGYFDFADQSSGKWLPGNLVRPASLPVWAHARGIKSEDDHYMPTNKNPIPDAYTSATPPGSFVLESNGDEQLSGKMKIFFEINQSWDWNEYWTNDKFPDDKNYKTSSQPSVIYSADIDTKQVKDKYELKAIGHGHYSGANGRIYPDLKTLTTALNIVKSLELEIR